MLLDLGEFFLVSFADGSKTIVDGSKTCFTPVTREYPATTIGFAYPSAATKIKRGEGLKKVYRIA